MALYIVACGEDEFRLGVRIGLHVEHHRLGIGDVYCTHHSSTLERRLLAILNRCEDVELLQAHSVSRHNMFVHNCFLFHFQIDHNQRRGMFNTKCRVRAILFRHN